MALGDSLQVFDPLANRPPVTGYATLDLRNDFFVMDFDDAADESAQFHAPVPSHYSGGSLKVWLTLTSTSATSGVAKLRTELTRLAVGDNLDSPPSAAGNDELTVTAPSTAGDLLVAEFAAIAVSGLTAGDTLQVTLSRLATDAADTLVGDVELVAVEIREA